MVSISAKKCYYSGTTINRPGQPGKDSQGMTTRTGLLGKNIQCMTARTGLPGKNSQGMTARTGLLGKNSQGITARTGLPGKDRTSTYKNLTTNVLTFTRRFSLSRRQLFFKFQLYPYTPLIQLLKTPAIFPPWILKSPLAAYLY
jgi:hypothetical protein